MENVRPSIVSRMLGWLVGKVHVSRWFVLFLSVMLLSATFPFPAVRYWLAPVVALLFLVALYDLGRKWLD